jgi:hypothetical protein
MKTTKNTKKQTGVSLDVDVFQILVEQPALNRSAWINDVVRREMVTLGWIEA